MLQGFAKIRAEVLKENAPKLYRQLKASGQLEKHCNAAAQQVVNSVLSAKAKGLNLAVAQSDAERQFLYEIPE
jgi:hypothetical protein